MQSRLVLALLLAGGCNPPTGERPAATCEEGEQRILAIAAEMTAQFASPCVDDDDCVVVRATGTCPVAGPFGLPDEAILFANVSEASEFVDDNAASLCPSEECSFPVFDNFYSSAVCVEGTCRGSTENAAFVCGAIETRLLNLVLEAQNALPSVCATDTDCVVVAPEWRCEEHGHVVTTCSVVAADQTLVIDEAALDDDCIDHPFDCIIEPDCAAVIPTCADGRCASL